MDGFRNVSDPKLVPTSRALLDFLALEGLMDEISTDMEELANPACMFLATKATRAVFQLDSRGPEGGGLGWDSGGGDVGGEQFRANGTIRHHHQFLRRQGVCSLRKPRRHMLV